MIATGGGCRPRRIVGGPGQRALIAKGASTTDGPNRPIRIQAQALRDLQDGVCSGEPGLFRFGETTPVGSNDLPNAGWCQADVERAIAAAEKAGLPSYRIEIGPDGTITILIGQPAEGPE